MSKKEIDRFAVLQQVRRKQLSQVAAAEILGISDRQVRNLLAAVDADDVYGLISQKRGRPSNHQKPKEFKARVLSIVKLKYAGFGPTFASEKLRERDSLIVHPETLRLWMIEGGIWQPKQKKKKTHPPRDRRTCFGEVIQADGSHHYWFGPNGPMLTLIVFIDDATSRVTALHFCEQETLDDYFVGLETHLKRYGIPRAFYTDRLKVFNGEVNLSQFQEALYSLGIESILARSPEAKGRVERVNRTLQDRLVKELMLRGIKTIEEANKYLPEYLKTHNDKFSKEPANTFDAHRPLEKDHDLDRLLCRKEKRILTKDYVFQFHNKFYKIEETPKIRRPKGRQIEIRITRRGRMRVFLGDIELKFKLLSEIIEKAPLLNRKELLVWKPRSYKPVSKTHPWKCHYFAHQNRTRFSG